MNHIKRIIIECILIVAIFAAIRGVVQKDSISEDVDRYLALKKRIAALPMCECTASTNLKLEYTHWCISHPYITINGKLRSEGDTVCGYKIISITADDIGLLCPEGHALELDRPNEYPLIGESLGPGVPIGRPLETGLVQQTPERLPELSSIYYCQTDPVVTIDGEDYRVGDTVKEFTIIEIRLNEVVFRDPQGEEVVEVLYEDFDDSSRTRKSNQSPETEIVPQSTESPIKFNAVYWSPTNIVVTTADGKSYSVGDEVNGFTIIDNTIWFTDPMGDTAVTPFYDPSYYRECKQSSEVESDGGGDPPIH